jgi:hypothetical protein
MTEERKHAILFAVTLLCARKLIETMESGKPNFAKQYFVDKALTSFVRTIPPRTTLASRTRLWLVSGWECRGRHLSRV